jgi:hypothetical protein
MPQGRPDQRRSPRQRLAGPGRAHRSPRRGRITGNPARPAEAASIDDRGWEVELPLARMARVEARYFSPDTSCGPTERAS